MTPARLDQETDASGGAPARWEGALDVADRGSDTPAGIAFAPLIGY